LGEPLVRRAPFPAISGRQALAEPAAVRGPAPAKDELGPDEIWKEPLDRLLGRLATTPAGLDSAEVQSRLATYGPNDAATVKRSPLWLQFLARFPSPLVIILLVASGLPACLFATLRTIACWNGKKWRKQEVPCPGANVRC